MSTPFNGADMLLMIETTTAVYTALARQRSMTLTGENSEIDASSKDDGADAEFLTGRRSNSIDAEALVTVGDPALQALIDAQAARSDIIVRQRLNDVDIEQATCVVTRLVRSYPDEDVASLTLSLRVRGGWSPV
jgi:TP901-1 family phage major tail protein